MGQHSFLEPNISTLYVQVEMYVLLYVVVHQTPSTNTRGSGCYRPRKGERNARGGQRKTPHGVCVLEREHRASQRYVCPYVYEYSMPIGDGD